VKPLSEQLADLSARAKKAEEDAAAARKEARDKVEERVDKLERDAQTRAAQVKVATTQAKDTVGGQWADLQARTRQQTAKLKADINAKKAEMDAKRAEVKAEDAEDNAELSIAFAYDAIDYAEAAVLDAVIARADADALA
jgi:hypothetical protein